MRVLFLNFTFSPNYYRLLNMISTIIIDLKNYGLKATIFHILDKISGNSYLKYNLYKNLFLQKKFKNFSPIDYIPYIKKEFKSKTNRSISFSKVVTFDEKIQWLKIYDNNNLKTKCADKYAVREYVSKKIGDKYLIPLLGKWDSFIDIDFNTLPDSFALKTNHGSGTNIIVKDKNSFDYKKASDKMNCWMKMNYAYMMGFELQYQNIKPCIIAEKYIQQLNGNLLDYKFHCFNGKMKFCQVIGNRDLINHTANQDFYDSDWNKLSFSEGTYPSFNQNLACPSTYNEMVKLAETLSEDFCYVRVDLYDIEGNIFFGELTFTPMSGFHPNWSPIETDNLWGSYIILPDTGIKNDK